MSSKTHIPQTTVRYYDSKGVYRERSFHDKEDLEAFKARLIRSGAELVEGV